MQFQDIPGQNEVKARLIKNINSGRIAHAQLFSGSEGIGVLSLVRACIQYLMCQNRGELDSCGTCPACNKNSKAIHPDVHFSYPVVTKESGKKVVSSDFADAWRGFLKEYPFGDLRTWHTCMNAEKKTGAIHVSEGAAMQKFISLKPFESKYRVLVVWQADKMNADAANKLLKSLEEPPEKTFFFLISHAPESLLDTIFSRTQEVRIKPPSVEDLGSLAASMNLDDYLLKQVFLERDRNLGQALSALGSGEMLTDEWEAVFIQWMRNCYTVKVPDLVDWSEKYGGQSRDWLKGFFAHCSKIVRDALMLQYQAASAVPLPLKRDGFTLDKFAQFIHEGNAREIYQVFEDAIFHIERNGNAKIILMDVSAKFTKLLKAKRA